MAKSSKIPVDHSLIPTNTDHSHRRIEELAAKHKTLARAAKDGRKNEPASGATHLSEVESELVDDSLAFFGATTRMAGKEITDHCNKIQMLAPTTLDTTLERANIRREVVEVKDRYRDDLELAFQERQQAWSDLRAFEEENRLPPLSAVYKTDIFMFFSVLLTLILAEGVFNAFLFQELQDRGLIGGLVLALAVGLANVLIGLGTGFLGWRLMIHVQWLRRLLGIIITVIFMTGALALHLALGDLREAITHDVNAQIDFLVILNPERWFNYSSIPPFVLFAVGIATFLIAALKGRGGTWGIVAPYWNHDVLDRRYRQADAALQDAKANLKDTVQNAFDGERAKLRARYAAERQQVDEIRRLAAEAHGISAAVRDTLTFLKNERRLAQRGQLTAFAGSMVSLACYMIAHWPQAAMLVPYRPTLGALSLGFLAATPLLALRQRGHRINSYFLRRYLYQQLDHLGYRRAHWWRRGRKAGNSVVVTGFGRFQIGGFELQLDDFVKNALVVGQLGSGKTIAVLNNVLFGLIASTCNSPLKISGLVLDAKGDFYGKLQRMCAQLGRADDLVILDPSTWRELGHSLRSIAWNPADNNEDPLEIATRAIAALRLIGLEQGNEGSFFLDSSKVFIRHALTLLRAAQISDAPSFVDVYRLALEDEENTSFYHELVRAIAARHPNDVPVEITDAIAYFEQWGRMADRQKSAVLGTLTQLLDEFLVQPFREIFIGKSTISISDIIDQGKILYVHMPASDRERMSRLICTLCKLEFSRQVLLRPKKARPSFFLCDEFQTFYTAGEGRGDSDFFERSRESFHCNVVATQNISAFLKRTHNPKDVMNFLGNCSVKIFLRNTEEETLRWSSGLFGQRSEIVVTMNEQAAFEGSWRRRHTTYGRSTRIVPRVLPDEFTRLAIPIKGDPMRQHAESIVHLGSRGETEHQRLIWPVNPLE